MSANYQQPEYVEKRLRYFDDQFLKDQDFIDEQKYHIDRQRRGDRMLKVSGISEGLKVTAQGVATALLEPGTAIDPKGRLVVLAEEQNIDLAEYKNKAPKLVISYQEKESDPSQEGSEGNRRWDETPKIDLVLETEDLPQDAITLAKLNVDKDGIVTVDNSVRQYSGIYLPSGDSPNGTQNGPILRSGGDSHSNLAVLTGDLSVTGNLSANGNIGIGTANPREKLEVSGNIKATGFIQPSAGNDETSGIMFPKNAFGGSGDRAWIRYYARQGEHCTLEIGVANDSADHIALMPTGNVGIGTDNPTKKLDVHGTIKSQALEIGNTTIGETDLQNLQTHIIIVGMIVMWSGAIDNIPSGWALCNGDNGTPDLRDRFLVGAGGKYTVNEPGGQELVSLTSREMPSHSHSASTGEGGKHLHIIPVDTGGGGYGWGIERTMHNCDVYYGGSWANANQYAYTLSDNVAQWNASAPQEGRGQHSHSFTTDYSGYGQAHENRPPYYALCFIMKL